MALSDQILAAANRMLGTARQISDPLQRLELECRAHRLARCAEQLAELEQGCAAPKGALQYLLRRIRAVRDAIGRSHKSAQPE